MASIFDFIAQQQQQALATAASGSNGTRKQQIKFLLSQHQMCVTDWLRDNNGYAEMMAWLEDSNTLSDAAVERAFKKFGLPKYRLNNRDSCVSTIGSFYNYWASVKLFMRYPQFDLSDNKNCRKIKELSDALETEKLNANNDKLATNNGYRYQALMQVINDLESDLLVAYASMNCSYIIAQQDKNETLSDLKTATQDTPATQSKNNNTNTIVTLIVIALVVVVLIKIFK